MMTRQMLSTVSSGRMPRWRCTRRRIMSASRAGRNAEPTSWVCFTWISRSMISPRCINRLCIWASIVSISWRRSASEGGEGGGLDILGKPDENIAPHPEERESAAPHHEGFLQVNHGRALTMRGQVTNFMPLRGHLSRPACSHVKQLAKQAGDNWIPAELIVQAGFFMA